MDIPLRFFFYIIADIASTTSDILLIVFLIVFFVDDELQTLALPIIDRAEHTARVAPMQVIIFFDVFGFIILPPAHLCSNIFCNIRNNINRKI